jgi:hypothetical protein
LSSEGTEVTPDRGQGDGSWFEGLLKQTVEIMRAAAGEFSLAALLVVAGLVIVTAASAESAGLACIAGGVGLGLLGHRRGLADVRAERRRIEIRHERQLAEIQQVTRVAELEHEERLAELASRERLADAKRAQVRVSELASVVSASGHASAHWPIRRGEQRRFAAPPAGIDELDYLIYRHTRSAETPPADPSLPPIQHFIDLRDAALIPEDRQLLVRLLVDQIAHSFPDHDTYTGVLVPREGNVALGLAVAQAMQLPPVLVRERPLFQRTTESILTGGLLILVDDIWSDGTVLRRAVELARFDNFSISDGVLLFARAEGTVIEDLAESNVLLRPRAQLSDADIEAILARVAAAVTAQRELLAGGATGSEAAGPDAHADP